MDATNPTGGGWRRPRPVAWVLFVLAFGLTVGLGTWQVKRLAWKEGVIAQIAAAQEAAPLTQLPTDPAALSALGFHRVTLRGTWVDGVEFTLAPRYVRDQFGYLLLQPFTLRDGRALIVNRGWVPGALKNPAARPQTRVHGRATVTGMLRADTDRGWFTPANQPQKNIWFARDVAAMAQAAHLANVVPLTLDLIGDPLPERVAGATLPIPSDGVIRLRNDHLSYIVTWYGIALGIVVIFVLNHRTRRGQNAT